MEDNIDLHYLLQLHLAGGLSDQQKLQLVQFLENRKNLQEWNGLIGKLYEETAGNSAGYQPEEMETMIRYILDYSPEKSDVLPARRNPFISKMWLRYAAVLLLFVGIGSYLFYKRPVQAYVRNIPAVHNDVPPGSSKAVLTLSDGKKIDVNSRAGQTIKDGKLAIDNKNGTLTYVNSDVAVYNTMTTPRGGRYKLTLADGTRVWLNAASSITFPTSFQGNDRTVSITGEAYFEVEKNASKPFKVKTYKDEITVKGTSFNVNSYTDEPGVKTSLLEGSVFIQNVVLKPGQASLSGKTVKTDMDQDLAWKNDVFNFHQVKLNDAMRQIARWYDVEVYYKGNFNDVELGGEIGRNLTLKQVLSGLQDDELHFTLEGKTLTVSR